MYDSQNPSAFSVFLINVILIFTLDRNNLPSIKFLQSHNCKFAFEEINFLNINNKTKKTVFAPRLVLSLLRCKSTHQTKKSM